MTGLHKLPKNFVVSRGHESGPRIMTGLYRPPKKLIVSRGHESGHDFQSCRKLPLMNAGFSPWGTLCPSFSAACLAPKEDS
jgi:hypothetical protein